MAAVDNVKAQDYSNVKEINGVSAGECWEALIAPKAAMQVGPNQHGLEECLKDKWMPLIHPGLLASGEYDGQTFIPERHVPRPSDHEFAQWLRNPDQTSCYSNRLQRTEYVTAHLGVSRTVLNQHIYQTQRQPGVLTADRHGAETRPYTGWLHPLFPSKLKEPSHSDNLVGLVKPTAQP